jgi:hypothetical protein
MIEIVHKKTFIHSGIFIKPISIGSPSEYEDNNDRIYKQTITCDIRTEWRQHIPIDSIMDAVTFCVDFGNLEVEPAVLAPNIRVSTSIEFLETIQNL